MFSNELLVLEVRFHELCEHVDRFVLVELPRRGVVLRLVFIDGGHQEQPVRLDIRSFRPLMRPRGLMAFHDCDPEGGRYRGVWRALESELLRGAADVVERAGVLWIVRLR